MHPRHTHFSVPQCGLYISPEHSYIGASPHGICQCDCCGTGCLEISSRFSTVEDAVQKEKNFCIYKGANGQFRLKRNHPYYLQVQCQIFVTGSLFCDFVVFTEKALVVVRIMPDSTAWEAALQKAKTFFDKCILPALMQATPCEGESSGVNDAGENCVGGGVGGNSGVSDAGENCVEGGVGGNNVGDAGDNC